jgi:hypothetical protein
MTDIIILILSFICGFISDFLWAKCVKAVGVHSRIEAANWAVLIYVVGLVSIILVINQNILGLILYGISCWIGIYIGVGKK